MGRKSVTEYNWLEQAVKIRAADNHKTLTAVFAELKLTHTSWGRLVRGEPVSGATFQKVAGYLGLTLTELIDEMQKHGMRPILA
jgi:hypothetical protein